MAPANQAECYRNKGQTPTKEALEFEKNAKAKAHRRAADLKPVKVKHHKTGGSCATVTPANQAECYRNKGQTPTKEALEFEKKANEGKIVKKASDGRKYKSAN